MSIAGVDDMVRLPGGVFAMGSEGFYPEEAPVRRARVGPFQIDRGPVSNRQFARFVAATGYRTLAELPPDPALYPGLPSDMAVPGSLVFVYPSLRAAGRAGPPWQWVGGADWRHPLGPGSSIEGLDEHPVVHVAAPDAEAYARWTGKALPTEAEWEFACRGGLDRKPYAWGDSFQPGGRIMANTWQGDFPDQQLCLHGFRGTSPPGSFPPNGYGLLDMIGNVWEWTADWFALPGAGGGACCIPGDPAGPPRRVIKGGSHLCAPNFCRRYRPAARSAQAIDAGTSHIGFRCVIRA